MLKELLSLEEIRQLRNSQKDLDIFFVVTFYNQEKHSAYNEFRYQIMKEIREDRNIRSVVGVVSHEKLPSKYAEFQVEPYSLREYLSRIAKARVAIYVRGLHDCLSFKFGQLLSLGMPIVGQRIRNNPLPGFQRKRHATFNEDITIGHKGA